MVPRDAGVAAKLRAAGAILLAKANLSEWSGARGFFPSGWSGRGGQTTSAYVPQGNPGGSSLEALLERPYDSALRRWALRLMALLFHPASSTTSGDQTNRGFDV